MSIILCIIGLTLVRRISDMIAARSTFLMAYEVQTQTLGILG